MIIKKKKKMNISTQNYYWRDWITTITFPYNLNITYEHIFFEMSLIRETLNEKKEMYKTTWMISLHLRWSFCVLYVECFCICIYTNFNKHYLQQSSWNVCVLFWTDFCGLRRNLRPERWRVPRLSHGSYSTPPPKFWDGRGKEEWGRGWKVPVNQRKTNFHKFTFIFFLNPISESDKI